ncbi:LacI family DNA-binding transcriptional regulator [Enterococcus hirae]|uniref:LacI family DNA-binding transcriptional regulator n=1 Tax=Enterococcus sp. C63 TaxID=3231324 RepID=UPI0019E09CB0|nr:LacI family DNA-binding transcriptional regulator [Enterococcus hirae]EMF0131168.1 LacI family DNA-binding transcriptional regulator [Enterococcus hirae]EMF0449381.1 LacI family DNA-binding transcriptional regulator [Enterococcus hirae]EMF0515290.1 LacI family DNA-binding transcriptional regulator [Enterococcus hirae]EMF0520226.1 LacI family DNA-binding transcriptional regulator [Enterococcus hirae]
MPTLADVAKKANVSKMTVSRVINHPEQVTDELKELVFSAMAELDYRPNIAAKALVSNRSQIIKLFILEEIDTTEPYYMNLLMGIAKCIGKAHYSLQLVTNDAFDVGSCDGYIITGVREKDFDWIDRLEKPVVLFGENRFGYDYVDSDNHYGTAKASQYAMECGYETIIYIGIDEDEPFELSREAGYLSVMETVNMKPQILRFPNHSTMAEKYLADHWSTIKPKTCFICSSDRLALGIVRGIAKEKGKIPEDFGVIGFDGVFLDQISSPKLTTVKQDIVRMGEVCGEMLLKKITEKGESQGYRRFFPELVIRETTR